MHHHDPQIRFQYLFWPNGRYIHDNSKGYVCWLLQIIFDNNEISKVKASFHLYCKQFDDDKYEYICEEQWFGHRGDAYGIHNSVMKLEDCKQFNTVEFCCDIKILDIVLKEK